MKKRWIAALALAAMLAAGPYAATSTQAEQQAPLAADESYRLASDAVFYLRALSADGTVAAAGTGVLMSSGGTAATAYHVVKGAARLEAVLADGTVVSVKVGRYDERTDAAVLELPARKGGGNYPYVSLRSAKLEHGDAVYAIGFPLKNTPIVTQGIVSSPDAVVNGRSRVLIDAAIASGMSGGPLLDEQGRLAGIISGSLRTMEGIHLAAGMSDLAALLPDGFRQAG
ncbi:MULTISPECIES: serine protease [unclassified Paenibacillus]|uniref:S1C family serine protease n=1 Tax=unclassified Paenibacillus TaxID=185978 RepID=UPI000953D380|nr:MULTISPECIES: serine protease [unclassified Paenibacillus]ASS68274.1 trypsin-like peptidase domain-containing protein [Paenibacillus sp. RUD330]SIR27003.1 Trypsin-like peptidase domain-containing protein [Paenibacillus sp. RU4X]SIR39739.1 Trypsin-like peptidase domain-containing protein [Paenibacillus sp. RU4T]